MKNIVIFASGGGSNAEKIMEFFSEIPEYNVSMIVSNNQNAGVLDRALKFGVPSKLITTQDLNNPSELVTVLRNEKTDLIVLAGFLKKIPLELIQAFPNRIVNIHPALLPKYGGKGMYGNNVHQAVLDNKESESGITIHFVNENYDEGAVVFQAKCPVLESDSSENLANRVLKLEHDHFSRIIKTIIDKK